MSGVTFVEYASLKILEKLARVLDVEPAESF
jgi:hypothetical protein